ncbi:TetR/AcrR family transcriptional regulator [Terrarubrum flagellatum]|uniref:TetR/AcrR family transcriptional regulator n=1 Tax=Terrirubrum flagellatum TaxID=2895980 RepID=UPI0031454998
MAKNVAPALSEEAPAPPRKRGPKVDVALTRQRKADIMREAARLFDKVGYHRVNMEMIAEAAGLKKPTLYHYIRSKDEILFAIHEAMIDALRRQLTERIERGMSPAEILRGICQDIFEQTHDFPGYVRAFFEHMRELDGEHRAKIRTERNAYMDQVMQVIKTGMDKGLFRRADVRLTALSLLGACNWSYQWYRPDRDPGPAEVAEEVWRIFSSGLLTRPA